MGPSKAARRNGEAKGVNPGCLVALAGVAQGLSVRIEAQLGSEGTCPGRGLDPQEEACRRQPIGDSHQ